MAKEDMLRRPRMARKVASSLLGMPEHEIPYGAFRAWLGRYRKKTAKMLSKEVVKEKVSKKKEKEPDWQDFVPTEPVSIQDTGPILKRVDYGREKDTTD